LPFSQVIENIAFSENGYLLNQWFPTFLISRHVQITTDKIKPIISYARLVFAFLSKTNTT